MTNLNRHYIGGRWVQPHSPHRMEVVNPATLEVYGTITLADLEDVGNAVSSASSAFEHYSVLPKAERAGLLKKLIDIYESRMEDMARAITSEMGACIDISRGEQVQSGLGHMRGFLAALEDNIERQTLKNGDILLREPIGVCGLITPWNWPMNQITLKVIPAIVTGNTCVLKPSEYTPLSSILFAQMIHDAGFPAGVFNLIQGDGPTAGAALSGHPDVQMISFTGSTRAGVAVSRRAARTVKRVTLELGGKSANIVFGDCGADLEKRVRASVSQCFYNQGQSCDAPSRLLVERSCYNRVVEIAADAGANQAVGPPDKEGGHIGPLVNSVQYRRVQKLIEAGIAEGGRLICGGPGKPDGFERGYYVRPTIFADVDNFMRIAREEVFGPVLVIIPFETEDDAVRIANDTPYGLAAYLQTGNPDRAERVSARLRAGAVHVNGAGMEYGSPFGGYKMSGNGREGGSLGLEDYQEVKTLHIR